MKKYLEIYNYYKSLINENQLKIGDRLPSIRQATQIFSVSKTTVLNAYFALQADGYIIANEKSGYFVSSSDYKALENEQVTNEKINIKYDLKSGNADINAFDLSLWQRYIKSALRQQERLLSYADEQGELDLRIALSQYIREKRNVVASPDRIVVGAGVQSLLSILCSLIDDKNSFSFPDNSFIQGINLCKSYGFDVHTRYKDAKIIYVCPSHMTSYGDVMPIKRRIELVKYSARNKSLVIEDDYDNDFMYQTKPTPSLYALSGNGNVVYMGSFSNVLIPSIRISFMVLTEDLAKKFKENKKYYPQVASKTEQIALCQYIRDGHINSQTRKIRRLYTAKTKMLFDELYEHIKAEEISISENSLQVKMKVKFNKDLSIFEENGISANVLSYSDNVLSMVLSPSAINEKEIPNVAKIIANIVK